MKDNLNPPNHNSKLAYPYAFAGAFIASIVWMPLLKTPFWQDDYGFLMAARIANVTGKSFWAAFIPDPTSLIWRPFTADLYWRLIEPFSNGNPINAHLVNYIIFVFATSAMGCFAASLRRVLHPDCDVRISTFAASLLYGLHGAFSLPMAWASGIQELGAILFSALTLRSWIGVSSGMESPRKSSFYAIITPFFLLAALFCKEGTVMLIALMLLLTIWIRTSRPVIIKWGVLTISFIITLVWFIIRTRHVAQPISGSPYSYRLGLNIFRNGASLLAFAFGVPRESIRFLLLTKSPIYLIWALVCLIAQGSALWLIFRQARKSGLRYFDMGFIMGIFVVALLPYLPLKWNCYPYYILLGLVSYAILSSYIKNLRMLFIIALLSLLATSILMNVENRLPVPAPIARARRAERALSQIANDPSITSSTTIAVIPRDQDLFSAIGWNLGLAYHLNRSPEDIPIYQDVSEVPMGVPYVIIEGDSNNMNVLR